MNGGLLCKEEVGTIEGKVSVHLIRRYLVISLYAVFSAGIHKGRSTDNICLKEDAGIFDRAVYVGFCGKVYYDVGVLFFKEPVYCLAVADVGLYEAEVGVGHNGL